jgi:hypothetical protein
MTDFLLAGLCLMAWAALFIVAAAQQLKRESLLYS